MTGPQDAPLLRVVRGSPSTEELAALLVVLTGRRAAAEPVRGGRPLWGRPVLRRAPGADLTPGPGAWRASTLPR